LILYTNTSNQLCFYINSTSSASNNNVLSSSSLTTNTWYHVAAVYDNQKAYLFAKFSKQAYDEAPNFYSFESVKITVDNHTAFVLYNATDIVVVCRGTELSDIKDITTDAKVILVDSQTGTGKAHLGFETAAKAVWPHVLMLINNYHTTQRVWSSWQTQRGHT
jgi:hypothetical protein